MYCLLYEYHTYIGFRFPWAKIFLVRMFSNESRTLNNSVMKIRSGVPKVATKKHRNGISPSEHSLHPSHSDLLKLRETPLRVLDSWC
mmetsp:Transcript_4938/g.10029  ORF Transcript_4938/g.10029 Transcript_4938/m.10029 type:complete len:87 (+) Transcript_4938:525-785(+)